MTSNHDTSCVWCLNYYCRCYCDTKFYPMSVDHNSSSSESSFHSKDNDIPMGTIMPYEFSSSEEDKHWEQENEISHTNNLDW